MKTAYYNFEKFFPKQFYLYFTFSFKNNLNISAYHDRRLFYKLQINCLSIIKTQISLVVIINKFLP
jgi:hypothetical protein